MRDLAPVLRAIALIEGRLCDDISVADMAAASGYSLFHFIRTFNQVVYLTPYDYLMRRRLSAAAYDLVHGSQRVVDVAMTYRFTSHETFTRAFKRLFGVQPSQWRERGMIPRRTQSPPISAAYLEHIHHPDFHPPVVVEKGELSLAGLMAPIADQPEATSQLWQSLKRGLETRSLQGNPSQYFGLTFYLEGNPAEIYYLAAVEVSTLLTDPPLLVSRYLPARKYACQRHCGPRSNLPLTLDFLYHTWLPKAGLKPAEAIELTEFGTFPPWMSPDVEVSVSLPVLSVDHHI